MKITRKLFLEKVGRLPIQDDLKRSNCNLRGFNHTCCGWCQEHDKPIFECGCTRISHDK